MANKPTSTSQDPAELAFSAVEDALKDSVFAQGDEEDARQRKPAKEKSRGQAAEKAITADRSRSADKIANQTSSFANDDRHSTSRLLYSMQARPSLTPILIALVVSLLWLGATALIGWTRFGEIATDSARTAGFLASLEFAGLLAIMILPVLAMFGIAILARRTQDLRIAATSMTQAAMRLTEPEATAADKVASVGQAVRREVNALGDGLERALSRAGELEVMVHNEVTALERTYSENEIRLRSLIHELSEQRSSVITNADRVRDAISEAHTLLVSDLDRIGDNLSGTIAERGEAVRKSIENATEGLDSTFESHSSSFVSQVQNRTADMLAAVVEGSNRVVSALDDRTQGMDEMLGNRTSALTSSIDARMGDLSAALDSHASAVSEIIVDRTSAISAAISSGSNAMISNLEERGYAMSGALEAIGTRISTDIGNRSRQSEEALTTITSNLDETMSIRVNAIESRFQTAIIEIGGLMEENTEKAHTALAIAGGDALSALTARVDEVSVILDNRIKIMDGVIGDKGEHLVQALDSHSEDFAKSANLLESALAEKTMVLQQSIDKSTGDFAATLEARTNALAESISSKTDTLSSVLEARTGEIGSELENRSAALSETIGTHTREFAEKIATRTQQLGDAIGTRTKEFNEAMGTRTQRLSETFANETKHLADTIDARTEALSGKISAHSVEVSAGIDGHGEALERRLTSVVQTVNAAMIGQVNSLSDMVSTKIIEVNANIGAEIDTAISRLGDAESGVTARIDSAAGKISEAAKSAAETIEFGVEHARSSITDMVDKRLGTLPDAITARAEITADRLSELNEALSTSITKSMAELEEGADRIEETVSQRISKATASISNDVEQSTARMDVAVRTALDQVKLAARHIEDLVEVKALHTAEQLGEKVAEMHRAVATQSANFSNLIDAKSEQLDSALRNHGNILRDALESSSSESELLVANSTGRMLDSVDEALNKLNDSNLLLQRVLETTTGNLASLETQVSDHTSTYASTVKDALGATEEAGRLVGDHVNAFQTSISAMVGQFGSLISDLDRQAFNIDKAANTLQDAGNFSIDTLENRRGAMEALAESFTARADDIDERMRAFAQSIADTMSQTEARMSAARAAMEETLSATGDSVSDRLQTLTDTADSQGQRAADALKSVQAAMLTEVDAALNDATRRFSETATAMRATAGQVSQELEATRAELQRGVVELPEETRASAAAMRRVVAEQIEALNELNNIVRAQSGTHDVSKARQSSPSRPAPRQPEPEYQPRQEFRPEPSRQDRRHDDRMDILREPAEQPRRPVFEPVPDYGSATQRTLEPRQAEARRVEPQRPAPRIDTPAQPDPRRPLQPAPQPAASEGGGWLRDVLRNASANQQQAGAQRTANLSGLTTEIARSIDPSALSEAWQRYQAGEANVFSRRIYTLSGQGTYDEVRKKLQRDPDFSATASAYMDEFEQVLQTAARGRAPAEETRQLLLSDRGKVYTMLAHASGRLS